MNNKSNNISQKKEEHEDNISIHKTKYQLYNVPKSIVIGEYTYVMDDLNQNWWIDEIDNDNKINEDDDNLNNNNDGYLIDYEPRPKKRRHIDIESNFIKKLFEDE